MQGYNLKEEGVIAIKQSVKRTLVVAGVIAATGLTAVTGLRVASAQSSNSNGESLVDKIATTFSLNKDDVQKVFDQGRDERKAEMEAKMDEHLAAAVDDGSLTQDQVDKIKAKREELKTFMDSLKDKTNEERRTAMEAKRTELEQWAKDNNIPDEFVRFARLHGHGGRGFDGPPPSEVEN